ncbi:methyltransferase [Candidatus Acidianus copahuensis]|uniref:Methyltransferase n=1 Tax=Candidatus Acidianus copahuensis TaxID=1160895 RepID=A0A031LSW1_9CREN|nr:methyltransferase [Candidatus Acidianus copahuensis]EZQ10850.1 methyltransferase [Candidatus Acidianus copahuensis]
MTKEWKRIEILGDIAIIGIPFNANYDLLYSKANEVMKNNKYVKSVWGRFRDTKGDFRLPTYTHIAGEKRSETIFRENGCIYFLDITKVFYSSKLSYEHLRIASQVKRGEKIINMFSGYGPFSILSAKIGSPAVVYSFDINPYAYYYMMANVGLNKTWSVIPIYGDAFKKIYSVDDVDRVICPLPEKSREAYEVAKQKVKPGGIIHLFTEVEVAKGEDPVKKALNEYKGAYFGRIVRSVKPYLYHVILDIKVD